MVQMDSINKLTNDLKNEDFLVRCDAIEALSYLPADKVYHLIVEMLDDRNYLVRCEAFDALANFNAYSELDVLVKQLKRERSSIVRMHAVATVRDLMKVDNCPIDLVLNLKDMFAKEESKGALIAYNTLFYKIEKEEKYIQNALKYIDDNDYHIRHNVINLLWDVTDEKVASQVLNEYKKRFRIEEARSVKISLEEQIADIEKI